MESAQYRVTTAQIDAKGHTFRANGSEVIFKGYMIVYVESQDKKEEKPKVLPKLSPKEELSLQKSESKQHFTQPPARFTDASLIRELEENGIGRPSTYAPTISTIVSRGYVQRVKKQLIPTELGNVTTDIMKQSFKDIVDVEFTANMEQELDDVEAGKVNYVTVLSDFYPPFEKNLEEAHETVAKVEIKDKVSDVLCDKCGRNMVYKVSKFGKFLACRVILNVKTLWQYVLQQAQNAPSAEVKFSQSSQSEEEHIMAVRSGRNVILWCGINPYRTGNAPIAADFCCRKTAEALKFIAITKSVAGQANKACINMAEWRC